jgi:hypothetical protein
MSTKLLLPLLNRITQDRGTKIDNLDTTISSRAPASTALSNATWTNTKAGYLDTTISSRAPASTALSNVTWTNTRAGYLDNLDATVSSRSTLTAAQVWSYGTKNVTATTIPSVIQSIQRGTTNFTYNGVLTTNVTISAVNTSKSIIISSMKVKYDYSLNDMFYTINFNSSTQIAISRRDNDSPVYVHWQIIEFK